MTMPERFHIEGKIVETDRVTVKVISDLWQSVFIAYNITNQCFGKMEFIFLEAKGFYGGKSRVTKKSIR